MDIKTWGLAEYSWGWEIRIDIIDDDGRIFNLSHSFDNQPTQEDISAAIQKKINFVEQMKIDEAIVYTPSTEEPA